MQIALIGGCAAACVLVIGSSGSDAATARVRAQDHNGASRAVYAQAWRECYGQFSGYRGPAGSNIALPAFESCFKQKTGRYPFQLGTP
jgi:hypothetical protein